MKFANSHSRKVVILRASGKTYEGVFVGYVDSPGSGEMAVICTFDELGRPRPHMCSRNGLLAGELGGFVYTEEEWFAINNP